MVISKVIEVDLVVAEAPENIVDVRSKLRFDLITMNFIPQGKQGTEREFLALAKAASLTCGVLQIIY